MDVSKRVRRSPFLGGGRRKGGGGSVWSLKQSAVKCLVHTKLSKILTRSCKVTEF